MLSNVYIIATVTISPSGIVSVCSGDQLELMCNVTGSPVLEWRIMTSQVYRRGVTSQGGADTQMSYLIIGNCNSTFTFTRISDENDMPLVSRLLISPVNRGLNGAIVICEDQTTLMQSTTTIIVTQDIQDDQHSMSRHNSVCMLME